MQTAFREVADSLAQRAHIGDQLAAREFFAASTARNYSLASTRCEAGVDDYINVLEAQRSLYAAQTSLITTRLLHRSNALTLYKVLGGGWDTSAQL